MFAKQKTKQKKGEDDSLKNYVKRAIVRTMRDDIAGVKEEPIIAESNNADVATDSPFLSGNKNIEQMTVEKNEARNNPLTSSRKSEMEQQNKKTVEPKNVSPNSSALKTKKNFGRRALLGATFLAILILLVAGVYFFLFGNKPADNGVTMNKIENEIGNENKTNNENNGENRVENIENKKEEIKENKFSDKVNFLTVEKLDRETITTAVRQTLFEMGEEKQTILEFLVVDENNQEISFSDFAQAMGIKIADEIKPLLTNRFSVFLYKKDRIERMGVSFEVSDSDKALAVLREKEPYIPTDWKFVLLDNSTDNSAESPFQDSIYEDVRIRFNNLNADNSLSIDYFKIGNEIFITTSKDSGRAVIEKILESDKNEEGEFLFNENENG